MKQESLANSSAAPAEEPSAFAVSSSRIMRRSMDDPAASAAKTDAFRTASTAAIPTTRVEALSPEHLLSSLDSLLLNVDAEKAKKVFAHELSKVKKAVGSAFFGDLGGKRKRDAEVAIGGGDEDDDRNRDSQRYSEQFKQVAHTLQ
jgi:hypothetical protein